MPVTGAGAGAAMVRGRRSRGATARRAASPCCSGRGLREAGRAHLGLVRPAPRASRAAAASARPRGGSTRPSGAGRRRPPRGASCRRSPPRGRGSRLVARAARFARSRSSRRAPLRGLGREPLVLRRRAREPVDAGHGLVERGRAEDHRDRIGLALDVEVAEEDGDALCDASSERRTISVSRRASASARASAAERASSRACSAWARASADSAA